MAPPKHLAKSGPPDDPARADHQAAALTGALTADGSAWDGGAAALDHLPAAGRDAGPIPAPQPGPVPVATIAAPGAGRKRRGASSDLTPARRRVADERPADRAIPPIPKPNGRPAGSTLDRSGNGHRPSDSANAPAAARPAQPRPEARPNPAPRSPSGWPQRPPDPTSKSPRGWPGRRPNSGPRSPSSWPQRPPNPTSKARTGQPAPPVAVATRPTAPVATASAGTKPTKPRRAVFYASRTSAALILVLLIPIAWSLGHTWARPGTTPLGVRTTEWVRDHGGRNIVAWAENAWYDHHKPKKGGLPSASALPKTASAVTSPPSTDGPPSVSTTTLPPIDAPARVRLLAFVPLPGEGVWQPTGRLGLDGRPLLYTTFMRPDPVHTSLVTGLAWMDPRRVRFQLYSGYQEPGGSGWPFTAPISPAVRPSLVATFNSGFKLADSRGGYYAGGKTASGHPLVAGKASFIIYTDGSATVGMWGRDATMGPDIMAVRQNLILLIDGGKEAPNLDQNSLADWGYTVHNTTLVWRSGVGVDARGHLIYAAGNGLSVHSLADVLLAAGCVRAMELDINSEWVNFFSYTSSSGGTVGTKLIPGMQPPVDRYFEPSDRDFIAAFIRPPV